MEYRAVLDSFQIPAAAMEASPGHVDSLVALFKGQSNRRATRHLVEIVEIPDRHGNGRTKDSITKYVQDAIGVKL